MICHSWLHQWKYTRTHQYRGEPSKKRMWARCVSPLVYDSLRKPPFPPLQRRRQTTAARYNATDRSEKATADCLPSHSLSDSLPLNPAFSAVVSIGDQYGTWSTRAWDHDIHPLHLEATQLAPWLWSQWAPSSKGARSSMPTTVRQTAFSGRLGVKFSWQSVWLSLLGFDLQKASANLDQRCRSLPSLPSLLPAFLPRSFSVSIWLYFLCSCAYSCSWWANGQHIDHACSTSKLGSTTKEAPSPMSGNNCRSQTVICAC